MGGWDVYCAICGSPFKSNLSIDSDDETDQTYSGEVIGESDLEWLKVLRGLGINPDVSGERKSFITGRGSYAEYGFVDADRGQDPNVPIAPNGGYPFYVYYDRTELLGAKPIFPFHEVCYHEILLRCFKGEEEIDRDVLYALFKELTCGYSMLVLDYGEPVPPREQFWECRKGEEVLVVNPVEIPQLETYLDPIRDLLDGDEGEPPESGNDQRSKNHDIFTRLPLELRHEIFNLLPIASVFALKAASWSMHTTAFSETTWKRRLETDIPWLWEVHEIDVFKTQELESRLSGVIADLVKKSQYKERPENVDYISGLVNRRRIWKVCEDIRSLYWDKLAESQGQVLSRTAPLAALREFFASLDQQEVDL